MHTTLISIENDYQAEELVKQLKAEEAEKNRLIDICKHEIEQYQQMIESYEQGFINASSSVLALLGEYCKNNAVKETKTTIQRPLPSGKLQWKHREPKVVRDNTTLLEWLKLNCKDGYIKQHEEPDWEAFKKTLAVNGDHMVTEDGEVVSGVSLEPQADVFEVK